MDVNPTAILAGFCGGVIFTLLAGLSLYCIRPWLRALTGGARVSILEVLGMRLRGNPPGLLVDTLLMLAHRGIAVPIQKVESIYIAHKGSVRSPDDLARLVQNQMGEPTGHS